MQAIKDEQPILYRQLHNSLKHGTLLHAYLFEGEDLFQLNEWATWAMCGFFCLEPKDGDPCLKCLNCRRIQENEHPDVLHIAPVGNTIKVEQIRLLQQEFGKSGMETKKRGFIISSGEKMSVSAANSLLKFLEEPQEDTLAIFTTTALGQILPTIQSRLSILHLRPLKKDRLREKLTENTLTKKNADVLSYLTDSFTKAVEMSEEAWFNDAVGEVENFVGKLSAHNWESFILVQTKLANLKEKKQQETCFEMIFYFLKKSQLPPKEKGELLSIFLEQKRKFQSNVSFQNALEQGVIQAQVR